MKSDALRKLIVGIFIAVPIISSAISALHIVDFFSLGNPTWLSIALAIAIELGSIASFLTLSILNKLNKSIVWSVFILLFFMQIVGNMYFSYEFISEAIKRDTHWITAFKDMIEFFLGELENKNVIMYLTILISWPIPIVSVFLLKSAIDYIKPDEKTINPINESLDFHDVHIKDKDSLRSRFQEDIQNEENNT